MKKQNFNICLFLVEKLLFPFIALIAFVVAIIINIKYNFKSNAIIENTIAPILITFAPFVIGYYITKREEIKLEYEIRSLHPSISRKQIIVLKKEVPFSWLKTNKSNDLLDHQIKIWISNATSQDKKHMIEQLAKINKIELKILLTHVFLEKSLTNYSFLPKKGIELLSLGHPALIKQLEKYLDGIRNINEKDIRLYTLGLKDRGFMSGNRTFELFYDKEDSGFADVEQKEIIRVILSSLQKLYPWKKIDEKNLIKQFNLAPIIKDDWTMIANYILNPIITL